MNKQLRRIGRSGHAFQARFVLSDEDIKFARGANRKMRRTVNSQVPKRQRRSSWLQFMNSRAAFLRSAA